MGLGQGFLIYQERVPGNQARTPSDPCFVLSSEVSTQTEMGFVDPGRTLLTQARKVGLEGDTSANCQIASIG